MNDFPFRRVSMNLRYRILTAEYTCLSRQPIRIWVESEPIVEATLEPSSSENREYVRELLRLVAKKN